MMNRAPSSVNSNLVSSTEDHPSPKTPTRSSSELYILVNRNDAAAPVNSRSFSGSKKFPVEVFTGSSAKPLVGGVPTAENGSMAKSSRWASTPAEASAASMEAFATVTTADSLPAASKAAATSPAQSASCSLPVSQSRTAVTNVPAVRVPHLVLQPLSYSSSAPSNEASFSSISSSK